MANHCNYVTVECLLKVNSDFDRFNVSIVGVVPDPAVSHGKMYDKLNVLLIVMQQSKSCF